jgi:predicted nucleic acid-binding protein
MKLRDLVLIDTCMWIPFFDKSPSRTKRAINELLEDDRAALIGPIVAEVLCGFRRDAQADWVSSALRGVHYIELAWDDWRNAAKLGRQLAAQGNVLPLSDLALATAARRIDCFVYSIDPHFDLVPDLKRFSAER